jgi:alpha-amylase
MLVPVKAKAAQRSLTLLKGRRLALVAKAYAADGTEVKATWASNKKSVATVSARGVITAKKPGKAVVTVKAGAAVWRISVTVVKATAKAKAVKVTSVRAAGLPKAMAVGQVAWLTGKASPARAAGAKITFASSAPGVLAVDHAGRAVAKAKGQAVVTVTAGTKAKKYRVTVE